MHRDIWRIVFVGWLMVPATTSGQTIDWIAPAGGSWFTPGNWAGGVAPMPGNTARFNLATTYNVSRTPAPPDTIAAMRVDAGNVTLTSAGVFLNSDLIITGDLLAEGGNLTLAEDPDVPFTIDIGDELRVGGGKTIDILPGLDISAGRLRIGISGAGSGTVDVTGAATTLHVENNTDIGAFGSTGTLNLNSGAQMTVDGDMILAQTGVAGTQAFVNITGGSDLTFIGEDDLTVGGAGTNQLASMIIDGPGSTLSFSDAGGLPQAADIVIGSTNGSAELVVQNSAMFTVDSNTGDSMTINSTGLLHIDNGGLADLDIQVDVNGGTIVIDDATLDVGKTLDMISGEITLIGGTINVGPGGLSDTLSSAINAAIMIRSEASSQTSLIENKTDNVELIGEVVFDVADGTAETDLEVTAESIFGNGGIRKTGLGTMLLRILSSSEGSVTYTQPLIVDQGTLILDSAFTGSPPVVSSSLIIGDGVGLDTVRVDGNQEFSADLPVTINESGLFNITFGLHEFGDQTFLNGGEITSSSSGFGSGAFSFTTLHIMPNTESAVISGRIDLSSDPTNLNVADGPAEVDLVFSARPVFVSLNEVLIKTGDGVMLLSGDPGSFIGTIFVDAGMLGLGTDTPSLQGGRLHNVIVGTSAGGLPEGELVWFADQQFVDTLSVFLSAVGSLTVEATGSVNLNSFDETIDFVTVNSGSFITNDGELTITPTGSITINDGDFLHDGGGSLFAPLVIMNGVDANLELNAGVTDIDLIQSPDGAPVHVNGGLVNIDHVEGPVDLAGGVLTCGQIDGLFDFSDGRLIVGTTSPALTLMDDMTMQSDATLEVQVDSARSFGTISAAGAVVLDGTLDVQLDDGFAPPPGQEFTIITAGEGMLSGGFDQIVGDGNFFVVSDSTSVTLVFGTEGDLTGDGCVDQQDLGTLLAAFMQNGDGDLDGDNDTDQGDLGILLANFGDGCLQ